MLKRLFDAGVTIVPGTDNVAGLSLHGELEIYERAGIPAANVLRIATLTSARVMKQDGAYGRVGSARWRIWPSWPASPPIGSRTCAGRRQSSKPAGPTRAKRCTRRSGLRRSNQSHRYST